MLFLSDAFKLTQHFSFVISFKRFLNDMLLLQNYLIRQPKVRRGRLLNQVVTQWRIAVIRLLLSSFVLACISYILFDLCVFDKMFRDITSIHSSYQEI